jgi:hypothetical protein
MKFQGVFGLSLAIVVGTAAAHTAAAQTHRPLINCSLRTLSGSYGFSFNGAILGVGPLAGVGVNTYDGEGHVSAIVTASINGNTVRDTATGIYTVSADCTGTVVNTFPSGQVQHLDIVLIDQGAEIHGIVTDPGVIATVEQRKQ